MPTETDIRLRSWLDANQLSREQMSRAVIALDPHYSDVRPRHPAGGPDGGRDIEAIYDGERIAYGAVGFQNSANDSDAQKKVIKTKFSKDLASALKAKPDLSVFCFVTNLHFTAGEKDDLKQRAQKLGIKHCDIIDRERLRIELDSPPGFFIRFQYLGLSLSEAEQASFLARYGDRIQEIVSSGFQRIETTLDRILFLQEAESILAGIAVKVHLDRQYAAEDIGHFRSFVSIGLRAVTHDIFRILFGSSDRPDRFHNNDKTKPIRSGIAYGMSTAQWEQHAKISRSSDRTLAHNGKRNKRIETEEDLGREFLKLVDVGRGSSIGLNPVSAITSYYYHDDSLIRLRPRLKLKDIDDCNVLFHLNQSLAEKISAIEIFANGYKLLHVDKDDLMIDYSSYGIEISEHFSDVELLDKWVLLRPAGGYSAFVLRFSANTPRRNFEYKDTPAAKRNNIK